MPTLVQCHIERGRGSWFDRTGREGGSEGNGGKDAFKKLTINWDIGRKSLDQSVSFDASTIRGDLSLCVATGSIPKDSIEEFYTTTSTGK